MLKFREYIKTTAVRLIVDDSIPGRLYFLSREKTSILYIVDILDNCIYINQNIIDLVYFRTIRDLIDKFAEEMDIFPYFDEVGDIEKLTMTSDVGIANFCEKLCFINPGNNGLYFYDINTIWVGDIVFNNGFYVSKSIIGINNSDFRKHGLMLYPFYSEIGVNFHDVGIYH
jgi:hypothetical protein